ncbi:MAG TPA: ParB/RepB/Spo0J family partition protein [Terriglobia bacterium]|nr:ParB/RepB/Spo0J family partition protein [Terriglobia bacterium]
MATTAAEKKDEKVEKRRALGRGLESLLPGPRVVSSELRVASGEGAAPVESSGEVGEKQIPHRAFGPVRNDRPLGGGEHGSGVHGAGEAQGGAGETAAMLAAGQPGPAVPTSEMTTTDLQAAEEIEAGRTGMSAPHEQEAEPGEVISIQAAIEPRDRVVDLDISLIEKNPYQTRYVFDKEMLEELRDSIKAHGVVQPIVVRPGVKEGYYILVLGERRLRASKMAGRITIPALVRRVSPQQAAEMTVLENVVRADLNPLEQAEAFRVLSTEFQLTQAQIALRIGVSRETVSNYMRLLRLPEEAMQFLLQGQLSFSEAREILSLDNPEHIPLLAREVAEKHLKWDQLEERIRELNGFTEMQRQEGAEARKHRRARWMDPNVRAAQTEMERSLGMRVRISDRNGRGKIVIEYGSVDDYERLVGVLRGRASS